MRGNTQHWGNGRSLRLTQRPATTAQPSPQALSRACHRVISPCPEPQSRERAEVVISWSDRPRRPLKYMPLTSRDALRGEVPRRRRLHPPGLRGTRAGHGQGHPRPRTADKEWSCDRPPLRAPHAYGPGRAPPGPRDRRKQAKKPPAPEPQPRSSREKASRPTPTAASPPATCSTSFKQFRHAATAQVSTRPPAPHTSARLASNPPPTSWPQHLAAAGRGQMHPPSARTASRTRPPQLACASHRGPAGRHRATRTHPHIPIGFDLFHDGLDH
jgi:hypothetical protein